MIYASKVLSKVAIFWDWGIMRDRDYLYKVISSPSLIETCRKNAFYRYQLINCRDGEMKQRANLMARVKENRNQ